MAVRTYLADSSIFIPFLRSQAHQRYIWRLLRQGRLLLSALVALELLQGARDREQRGRLRGFFQSFERLGLVSTPLHEDWLRAGDLLSAYSRRRGEVDSRKHQNDVLIVVTARRLGLDILTDNVRHMTTWAGMLEPRRRPAIVRPDSG